MFPVLPPDAANCSAKLSPGRLESVGAPQKHTRFPGADKLSDPKLDVVIPLIWLIPTISSNRDLSLDSCRCANTPAGPFDSFGDFEFHKRIQGCTVYNGVFGHSNLNGGDPEAGVINFRQ